MDSLEKRLKEAQKIREFVYRIRDCQHYWWTGSSIDRVAVAIENPVNEKIMKDLTPLVYEMESLQKELNRKQKVLEELIEALK